MYPVYIQAKNPWDYENPEHIERILPYLPKKNEGKWSALVKKPEDIKELLEAGNWGLIENPKVIEAIQKAGFDAAHMQEMGVKNIGVFDPKVIKSATGNRGTYDIEDPDITKAAGGAVMMSKGGVLGALAKTAEKGMERAMKGAKAVQQVLPAAEREANLAKFLEASKVQDRLYRGQRRAPKTDKFVTTQGRAVPSFTTDPEVGNVYSRQLETGKHGSGSTSVPVHVQMTNPLDIRDLGEHVIMDEFINRLSHDLNVPYGSKTMGYYDLADMLEDLDKTVYKTNAQYDIDASSGLDRIRSFEELADAIREAGESKNANRILEDLLPTASIDAYSLADHPAIVDELRRHGYDALIHKDVFDAGMPYYQGNPENIQEGFTSENVIDAYRPFEQGKIKSAVGNRGTYDINDPDITKAAGGRVTIDEFLKRMKGK
jgi:hypothetical protein